MTLCENNDIVINTEWQCHMSIYEGLIIPVPIHHQYYQPVNIELFSL